MPTPRPRIANPVLRAPSRVPRRKGKQTFVLLVASSPGQRTFLLPVVTDGRPDDHALHASSGALMSNMSSLVGLYIKGVGAAGFFPTSLSLLYPGFVTLSSLFRSTAQRALLVHLDSNPILSLLAISSQCSSSRSLSPFFRSRWLVPLLRCPLPSQRNRDFSVAISHFLSKQSSNRFTTHLFMTLVLYRYAEFQISDTPAGNAKAEAEAVFVTPFEGVDLATVPDQDRDNAEAMRKQAEDAETELFNPVIDAADGEAGTFTPSLHYV